MAAPAAEEEDVDTLTPDSGAARDADTQADAAIEEVLQARALHHGRGADGTWLVPFAFQPDGPVDVQVRIRAGGWAGAGIAVRLHAQETTPPKAHDEVLRRCNEWNARTSVPKAQLVDDGPSLTGAKRVVLDGWLPTGERIDADVVRAFVDLAVVGGLAFWQPAATD